MSASMEALDARLENWERWLHNGSYIAGRCASLEGDYRSPQSKHWHPPGPRPIEAKAADAWDITLAAATLPIRLHLCLRLKYVIKFNDQIIASIFREDKIEPRCKAIDIPAIDWEARCDLLEALGQPVAIRRIRAVVKVRALIAKQIDLMVD